MSLGAKLSSGGAAFGSEKACGQARDFRVGAQLSFDDPLVLRELKPKRAQIKRLGEFHDPPLIVSYGANRYLGERNSIGADGPDTRDHIRLSESTELYDVEELLLNLHHATSIDSSAPEGPSLAWFERCNIENSARRSA